MKEKKRRNNDLLNDKFLALALSTRVIIVLQSFVGLEFLVAFVSFVGLASFFVFVLVILSSAVTLLII